MTKTIDVPARAAEHAVKQMLSQLVDTTFEKELMLSNGSEILKNLKDIDASSASRPCFAPYTAAVSCKEQPDQILRHIFLIVNVLRDGRCARQEGIFRIGANRKEILDLVQQIKNGKTIDYVDIGIEQRNVHVLTSLLKRLLQTWDRAVIAFDALPMLRKILALRDARRKLEAFQLFFMGMENTARTALQAILGMLQEVHKYAFENKMTAENLSRCISQSLVTGNATEKSSAAQEAERVYFINSLGEYLIKQGCKCLQAPSSFAETLDRCVTEEIVDRCVKEQTIRSATPTPAEVHTAPSAAQQDQLISVSLQTCNQWREKYAKALHDVSKQTSAVRSVREKLITALEATAALMTSGQEELLREAATLRQLQPSRMRDLKAALVSTPRRARKALSRLATPRSRRQLEATQEHQTMGVPITPVSARIGHPLRSKLAQTQSTTRVSTPKVSRASPRSECEQHNGRPAAIPRLQFETNMLDEDECTPMKHRAVANSITNENKTPLLSQAHRLSHQRRRPARRKQTQQGLHDQQNVQKQDQHPEQHHQSSQPEQDEPTPKRPLLTEMPNSHRAVAVIQRVDSRTFIC
eukprot:m.178131 g.178131  ORF g.178131 m.178131 type:complete len:583 (+) comp16585_c0_seq5:115-1863(+)